MIYHNITPHEYFINIHPYLVEQIVNGRAELSRYSGVYDLAIADSEFNKNELENYGYKNVVCVPVKPDFDILDGPTDSTLMEILQDGKKNILFVGRVTPNKGHADLIKSFYFLNKSGLKNTRLIMVGEYRGFEKYYWWLEELCRNLKLDNVMFPGLVEYTELIAYYRTADLFVCLSQHEGFCVPLLEAMYFGVPILALEATAVPYTLRDAGLTVTSIDYWKISELMMLLLENEELRNHILKKQDEVIEYYRSFDLASELKRLLAPLLS
jgi:glycosyltransferase involved in cell wall biosynthesis